ncbi:MAG: hypothetical protein IAA81_08050 [Spirochaetes bacterium]|uniref:Uncharacterized protein n=1 Tax=Candidatus Gallitreponema excrementavium TaxID=2840840 RepID=A0A9D9N2W9_9SPIR|nr:hypothetical protein [Candidatus Gallitreponema excrementavium]
MEGSCIGFWKSKANSTFCKVVKQKGEAFWHRNTHVLRKRRVPKLQKAALFAIVCRFSPWNVFPPMKPAVWGFGLGLLGGQGVIGAKASLDPLCRALRHRVSFWQPLQPWFVKETAFFSAKTQKLQKATLFVAVCLVTQSFGFRAKGSGQPGKNSVSLFVFVLSRYLSRVGSGGKL